MLDVRSLPDNLIVLKDIIIELQNNYILLEEKYLTLKDKYFGSKSENFPDKNTGQLQLFNEAETYNENEAANDIIEEKVIIRKRPKGKKTGRRPLPDQRHEVIHDLDDKDKKCSCCDNVRLVIGEDTSEELDIERPKIIVIKHIQLKYGPCNCEDFTQSKEPEIKTANKPKRLLPGSIASAGLLAHIFISKFLDSLPYYRQEKMLKRIDIDISRSNMCNWQIAASRKCQVLIDMLWEEVLKGKFLQMDETTCQVLREPGRPPDKKSYMWITIGYTKGA